MRKQGRIQLLTIPRAALILCMLAIVAASLFLYSISPARAASASCTTITSNRTGTDGYFYSFWTAGVGRSP
nr:hypothetical protein [Reticulibacter mediterranei]